MDASTCTATHARSSPNECSSYQWSLSSASPSSRTASCSSWTPRTTLCRTHPCQLRTSNRNAACWFTLVRSRSCSAPFIFIQVLTSRSWNIFWSAALMISWRWLSYCVNVTLICGLLFGALPGWVCRRGCLWLVAWRCWCSFFWNKLRGTWNDGRCCAWFGVGRFWVSLPLVWRFSAEKKAWRTWQGRWAGWTCWFCWWGSWRLKW